MKMVRIEIFFKYLNVCFRFPLSVYIGAIREAGRDEYKVIWKIRESLTYFFNEFEIHYFSSKM